MQAIFSANEDCELDIDVVSSNVIEKQKSIPYGLEAQGKIHEMSLKRRELVWFLSRIIQISASLYARKGGKV